ncbi:MAG: CRISPR-associated protein Cas5 [Candidatus Fervidibacter sp.]|uniref:CRISPR-associated protein Cas5 n=1 Tax=Candidatus Fervidibacter sp. TaxID=3100871 RepID=UPI00404A33C1
MTRTIDVCIFQVRGQFAHWRKWFTMTSPLTYSFPQRTAVVGMVGAILRVPQEEVADVFKLSDTRIAVCPLKPIQKDRLPQKWR